MEKIYILFITLFVLSIYINGKELLIINRPDTTINNNGLYSYSGKIIRRITIVPLNIYGQDIDETKYDTGWIGKDANALHFLTKNWVIRNHLLFTVGDSLNPAKIIESERIIRNSKFAVDAKIKVLTTEYSDSVDIRVITLDKWTLLILASYNANTKSSDFSLQDNNLFGMGHSMDIGITYDSNKSIGLGAYTHYTAYNVSGSFINTTLIYEFNKRKDIKSFGLLRPFASIFIDWAGGFEIRKEKNVIEFRKNSQIIYSYLFSYNRQDIWIGRTFRFDNFFLNGYSFSAAIRYIRNFYDVRPYVSVDSNRIFSNSNMVLGSLSVLNRTYYKERFVEGFGHTEDVPVGLMLSVTYGIDNNEFKKRFYSGMNLILAKRFYNIGYLSLDFSIGGFKYHNNWEQNIISTRLIYHSPLYGNNNWRHRFFSNLLYIQGGKRYSNEQIFLDSKYFLRGFKDFQIAGTKRLTLNLENRFFSPFKPLGFQISGVAFSDFGLISYFSIFKGNKLFQAYGGGIRINNESINNANLEISLIYNPFNLLKKNVFSLSLTTSFVLGFEDFNFTEPAIIEFLNK